MVGYQYLTRDEIIEIHQKVLDESGGVSGVLFDGNIDSAALAPGRVVFGHESFVGLHEKAAALLHEINKLHPFVDGNKRTAYESTHTFLILNGHRLGANTHQARDISLRTAECTTGIPEVTEWISEHSSRSLR